MGLEFGTGVALVQEEREECSWETRWVGGGETNGPVRWSGNGETAITKRKLVAGVEHCRR